ILDRRQRKPRNITLGRSVRTEPGDVVARCLPGEKDTPVWCDVVDRQAERHRPDLSQDTLARHAPQCGIPYFAVAPESTFPAPRECAEPGYPITDASLVGRAPGDPLLPNSGKRL